MATRTTMTGRANRTTELLIITPNQLGAFARITAPLAKVNINVECFTAYEWGGEAAFRIITNNNKKARDVLKMEGFNIQENPVVLWTTENTPGQLRAATTALAEARVNTYCSYSTTQSNTNTTLVVFGTNDADRTMDILKRLR